LQISLHCGFECHFLRYLEGTLQRHIEPLCTKVRGQNRGGTITGQVHQGNRDNSSFA
jgi:hypothetical protein